MRLAEGISSALFLLMHLKKKKFVGKKRSYQGHFIKKKFSSFPPPRHVSCEKARWRAVQEPTVPGLSIYNDPRSHKPLPSQWITFSNSTHSKFIYLQTVCAHTHTHSLNTHTPRTPGRKHAARTRSVVTHNVQPVRKCRAKFCNS